MPDPTRVGTWLALLNGICLFIVASIRKQRLDAADAGLAGVAFVGSYNLYPPVVLIRFGLDKAAADTLPVPLHGYEKYLALAAFFPSYLPLSASRLPMRRRGGRFEGLASNTSQCPCGVSNRRKSGSRWRLGLGAIGRASALPASGAAMALRASIRSGMFIRKMPAIMARARSFQISP